MTFIPNWVRQGFKSKEDCMVHVLSFLKQNEGHIIATGVTDEITIQYGNTILYLKGKGDPKKDKLKKYAKKQLKEVFV